MMSNRTLYMDLNGKVKRGFEGGQPYRYTSIGKETAHLSGLIPLQNKAKARPDYEYWMKMANTRV